MKSITPSEPGSPVKESSWACFTAPSLILLAPFIAFIDFYGYPFTNPEVLWLISGALLFSAACGLVLKNTGSLGRALLTACLLEFSLDLIGGFELKGKIICAMAVFLFSWFLQREALKISAFVFSIFIALTLVFAPGQLPSTLKEYNRGSGESGLPPVIHLILDGHIGVEGIPKNIYQGRQFKKNLQAFYADNGFRLYGNAYSHFDKTINSVPSLLNFDTGLEADKKFAIKSQAPGVKWEMIGNKYFHKMSKLGYRIKVYQSSAYNFCQEKFRIASCYTYQPFSLQFLENLSASVSAKMRVILSSYLFRSEFFRTAKNGYWHLTNFIRQRTGLKLPYPWNWNGRQTSPVASSQALQKLSADIRSSPEGTLFFAHLLIPHAPFIYDPNCRIYKNPIFEWSGSGDPAFFNKENSGASRAERYKKYLRQIKCLNLQLQGLFDAMRSAKIYDGAAIIIHGDHGSRIRILRPVYATRNDLTSQDLQDSFSVLFAVKASGNKAGYDLRVLSLNQIFSQVAGKIFNDEKPIAAQAPYVNIRVTNSGEKKKRAFVRRPYPISEKN